MHSRYYDASIGRFINADTTSELAANNSFISFNLYAYCGNNPILNCDPAGLSWFESVVNFVLDLTETAIDAVQSFTSKLNICVSHGFAGNGSPGLFDDVQAWAITSDTAGNIALQIQPMNLGVTSSTSPSASAVRTTTVMFAHDYTCLNEDGASVGASVFSPYYGLGGGIDYNFTQGDKVYHGFTVSAGVGVPSIEAQALKGKTKTILHINIYDTARSIIRAIRKMVN